MTAAKFENWPPVYMSCSLRIHRCKWPGNTVWYKSVWLYFGNKISDYGREKTFYIHNYLTWFNKKIDRSKLGIIGCIYLLQKEARTSLKDFFVWIVLDIHCNTVISSGFVHGNVIYSNSIISTCISFMCWIVFIS